MKPVHHVPQGFHAVTPCLLTKGAARLLAFLQQVFDARVQCSYLAPDGTIAHSEILVGDSVLMVAEVQGVYQATTSQHIVFVPDVDATWARAVKAGATAESPPQDEPYGARKGTVIDAFGNRWGIATQIEEVSEEEIQRRMGLSP